MSRTTLLFALVLAVLGIAVAIKHFTAPAASLPPLPGVILAFGDSLTQGTGAQASESYPARLEQRIAHKVINAGVPGELSEEGLKRLGTLLDLHRPGLVLLCHGGNDLLKKKDENAMRANLEAMVRLARERGVDVVLIAVPEFSLIGLDPHPVYEAIAEAHAVPIEKTVLSEVLGDNRTKSDYVHPNAAGYEKMAEAVEKVLRKHYRIER